MWPERLHDFPSRLIRMSFVELGYKHRSGCMTNAIFGHLKKLSITNKNIGRCYRASVFQLKW